MWKAGYADNPLQTTLDVSFPNHLMQPSYFSLEKTEDREGKAEQLTSVQSSDLHRPEECAPPGNL